MKKVQFKLKNKTRAFSLAMLATLVLFTGCNSYDDEITDLQGQIDAVVTDVATLKTSVAGLQTSVSGMTYIKSITMGTDGKLTITPSVGTAIVYDAKNYVTYDIKLEGNNLIVNGANKGSVVIPPLTFENGVLKSGTAVVADLTAWMKSGLTVVDGFLAINGQKTTVAIPVDPGKTVKDVALDGTNVKVTYTDGTSTVFANVPFVASVSATTGNLVVNGVDTGVKIKNEYTVVDGFLAVNGVKTTVAIPADNEVVLVNKVGDEVVSVTITDAEGDVITVKVNPTNELLSSILFVPEWINQGLAAVELGFINGVSAPVGKVMFTEKDLIYRFNPTTADLSKTTWKFVNNSARVDAPGPNGTNDATTLFAPPTYTANADGSGKFSLKVGTWVEPAATQTHLIALQANGFDFYSGKASSVVSDYAKIMPVQYDALIANAKLAPFTHYPVAKPATPTAATVAHHEIYIDATTPTNLKDLVWATAKPSPAGIEKRFEDYNFNDYEFVFTDSIYAPKRGANIPVNYDGVDGVTNQNYFINIEANNDIRIIGGTSAIDRRPLVMVVLRNKTTKEEIKYGYIMFHIKRTPAPGPDPLTTYDMGTFGVGTSMGYQAMFKGQAVYANNLTAVPTISWEKMNQVYAALGMTHNEFRTIYPMANLSVVSATYAGVAYPPANQPGIGSIAAPQIGRLTVDPEQTDVDTYAILYEASPYSKFGKNVVKFKYTPTDVTKYRPLEFTFEYTVTAPTLEKAIIAGYQYSGYTTPADKTIITQGVKNGAGYEMKINLGEAFGFGSAALKARFAIATNNKIDGATHDFIVTDNYVKALVPSYLVVPSPSANTDLTALLGTSIATGTNMSMNPANPLDIAQRVYPTNFKTSYINGEVDNFNYNIIFRNPITIELATSADFNLLDIKTGAKDQFDVSKNYIVKMLGEIVVDKGVVQPAATAYGMAAATLTYTAEGVVPAYDYAFDFTTPIASWENAGTRLTSTQKVADLKVVYHAGFAVATRTDEAKVDPDPSASPVKRK